MQGKTRQDEWKAIVLEKVNDQQQEEAVHEGWQWTLYLVKEALETRARADCPGRAYEWNNIVEHMDGIEPMETGLDERLDLVQRNVMRWIADQVGTMNSWKDEGEELVEKITADLEAATKTFVALPAEVGDWVDKALAKGAMFMHKATRTCKEWVSAEVNKG